MTGGVHLAAREREGESNGSGRGLPGPRARSGAGLNGFPGALFFYFYSPLLLFYFCFLFLLYLLQKGFNSIQTTFRNFLKFKIIIQNSNKQVFIIKTTFLQKPYEMAKGFYLHNANRNWI
jgi:O-antigen/teichoic acid export membrane protein